MKSIFIKIRDNTTFTLQHIVKKSKYNNKKLLIKDAIKILHKKKQHLHYS